MKKRNSVAGKWALTTLMLLVGIAFIFPFLFMISASFKLNADILQHPLQFIPNPATLLNYEKILTIPYAGMDYAMAQWYFNTVVMSLITIILKVTLITFTAYGFSKIKFPGRDIIFMLLLASMMIPGDILIMPRYMLYSRIGIIDTMWSIILPAAVDAYFVFMLRQSFLGISDSISEAAKIDGCSHFRIYWRIVTPLAMPAVATMVLFSFVWVWNDYMSPYLYITPITKTMLSVGIKMMASGQTQDMGAQMAGAAVVLLPVIVLFVFCQRFFVEGISSGAVKG